MVRFFMVIFGLLLIGLVLILPTARFGFDWIAGVIPTFRNDLLLNLPPEAKGALAVAITGCLLSVGWYLVTKR